MVKINILSRFDRDRFLRQLDLKKFPTKDYLFCENSHEDVIWDMVIVFEGVSSSQVVKVKDGGLVFISGEPPSSEKYPYAFTKQFDWVITCHESIKHKHKCLVQQALNWHYAYNRTDKTYNKMFDDLRDMDIPHKTKNISIITSNQRMMPGHSRRMALVDKLLKNYADKIDLFGKGFKYIDDKAEALDDYFFHICIENSCVNNYWTEKLADPLLAYTVPIYVGAPNIGEYFDTNGMPVFSVDDVDGISLLIDKITENPQREYDKYLETLKKNRDKLLNDYNLFPFIMQFYTEKGICNSKGVSEKKIRCSTDFFSYRIGLFILRLKRFIFKQYYKLNNEN